VPRLAPATEEQVRRITAESHVLWGGGLAHEAYLSMWKELAETPWARRFFTHYAWVGDDGALLSSAKVYRPLVRLGGEVGRATAVGAVFTPKSERGRGHASALLRAVVEEADRRGDGLALLFSDIGTDFYGRLGFIPLPAEEAEGVLDGRAVRRPGGIVLRPMVSSDGPAVLEAHEASSRGRSLAVVRDPEHWSFLVARTMAYLERSTGQRSSAVFRTATEAGRFAGYLVAVCSDGTWNLREAASAGGDSERLRAVLLAGAAEARSAGARRIYGWLPREFGELVPEWKLRFRPRQRAIPMVRPLGREIRLPAPLTPSSAYLWPMDHF